MRDQEKRKKADKTYRDRNKEATAARGKAWREANKEAIAAKQKAWREGNKEHIQEQSRLRRTINIEEKKAKKKTYYDANRDLLVAKKKVYNEATKDDQRAYRTANKEIIATKRKARPFHHERTSYHAMKQRCTNPRNESFEQYGKIGIMICPRWLESFENFLKDMGERPEPKNLYSIDRYPNQSGNYEPGNCRWATSNEQANNLKSNLVIEFNGESMTLTDWAKRIGINSRTLDTRLRRGWSIEKTLTTPVNQPKKEKQDLGPSTPGV